MLVFFFFLVIFKPNRNKTEPSLKNRKLNRTVGMVNRYTPNCPECGPLCIIKTQKEKLKEKNNKNNKIIKLYICADNKF